MLGPKNPNLSALKRSYGKQSVLKEEEVGGNEWLSVHLLIISIFPFLLKSPPLQEVFFKGRSVWGGGNSQVCSLGI